MLEIILTVVAAAVGFRVLEKGNLFLGLAQSKEDLKDLGTHAKESAATGALALKKSKTNALLFVAKEELEAKQANKKWESEEYKRKRERVAMVQSIYRPVQDELRKETEASQIILDALQKSLDAYNRGELK